MGAKTCRNILSHLGFGSCSAAAHCLAYLSYRSLIDKRDFMCSSIETYTPKCFWDGDYRLWKVVWHKMGWGHINGKQKPPTAFLSFAACPSTAAATNRGSWRFCDKNLLDSYHSLLSNANDPVASFYSIIPFWFSVRSWCIDGLMLDCT